MMLDDIIANKKRKLLETPKGRFRRMLEEPEMSLVCELKLTSPTHPKPFTDNPKSVFAGYKAAGVDAISAVTDQKYFGGSIDLVTQARATGLPVLRKDFVLEPRQITEVHTDALLLIARILSVAKLKQLASLCLELDIEPVVEIHSEEELKVALASDAKVIAVNSRDLQIQKIDIGAGLRLLDKVPRDLLTMFFSGVASQADILQVKAHRANGVLIGTSILTSNNRVNKIHDLKEIL